MNVTQWLPYVFGFHSLAVSSASRCDSDHGDASGVSHLLLGDLGPSPKHLAETLRVQHPP
eukprot:2977452-Heterocapsa_arctica.AAC.1